MAVPAAFGALGDVVSSYPTPANGCRAVAVGGAYLYAICTLAPDYVITCDLDTGSRVSSFICSRYERNTGLGYEYGGYLWIAATYRTPEVLRCHEGTGSVYSSFPVTQHNLAGGLDCRGDPTRPATLAAIICHAPNVVTYHASGGSLLGSFGYAGSSYGEPAWDYGNNLIWFPEYVAENAAVVGYATDGSVVASFAAPASRPRGAAYLGGYLWISTGVSPNQYIYKVHCPDDVAVAPASIGRVKALFR